MAQPREPRGNFSLFPSTSGKAPADPAKEEARRRKETFAHYRVSDEALLEVNTFLPSPTPGTPASAAWPGTHGRARSWHAALKQRGRGHECHRGTDTQGPSGTHKAPQGHTGSPPHSFPKSEGQPQTQAGCHAPRSPCAVPRWPRWLLARAAHAGDGRGGCGAGPPAPLRGTAPRASCPNKGTAVLRGGQARSAGAEPSARSALTARGCQVPERRPRAVTGRGVRPATGVLRAAWSRSSSLKSAPRCVGKPCVPCSLRAQGSALRHPRMGCSSRQSPPAAPFPASTGPG